MKDELLIKDRALNSTSDGVSITDAGFPDQPIIYVNPAFERITGYPANEILGRNPRFLQSPDSDPQTIQRIQQSLKNETPCEVEILNVKKDGTPFWNRFSLTPIRDGSNTVTHYIGVHTDITERKHMEDALRFSKAEIEKANQIMQDNLKAAAKLQRSLLPPLKNPLAKMRTSFLFESYDYLSGDMLNIVPLDKDHTGFYVLDVSGHSIQAALLTVTLSRWLSANMGISFLYTSNPGNSLSYRISRPAEVMNKLNEHFPFDPDNLQYFTVLYGVYSIKERKLQYASAGHPSPIFIPKKDEAKALPASGFPIGFGMDEPYEEYEVRLKDDDRVLFYSDGIIEALNSKDEDFGVERLAQFIEMKKNLPMDELLSSAANKVKQWSMNNKFQDDATMLVFEGI